MIPPVRKTRRGLAVICVFFAVTVLHAAVLPYAAAQPYPARPVRLVVPFPAGESVDAIARLVAQPWSASLGQPIVIDNRSGAGGTIGCEAVAKSPPDGYTLLWGNVGPLAIAPSLYRKLGYDVARDFTDVSLVAVLPFVLFAAPTAPFDSLAQLTAYAKAHPGELNFASTGVGSGLHLIGELFKSAAGVDIVHVPYKGVGQALPEILAGKIQLCFNTIPAFLPLVQSGRLKALTITAQARSPLLPGVATTAELGLPAVQGSSWHAVLAPAGTPPEVVRRLSASLVSVLAAPALRTQLAAQGADPTGSSPEELHAFIERETAKWAAVIKSAGVQQE